MEIAINDSSNSETEKGKKASGNKKERIRSKYSVEYMKKIVASGKLAEDVTIKFGKDYPVSLEYKETDKFKMSFILAPRVDND